MAKTNERLFQRLEGRVALLYGADGLLKGTIVREIDGRHSMLVGREAWLLPSRRECDAILKGMGYIVA